jgi:NADH oxidase (H2O2-forming)
LVKKYFLIGLCKIIKSFWFESDTVLKLLNFEPKIKNELPLMKIVIVGNGIAGSHVAFTLRELNYNYDITIISAENGPEYDPCSLPYFISGEVSRDAIFRRKIEEYKENNITLIENNKATSIDPILKKINTEKGNELNYDKLILAYGGKLFIPDIKGVKKEGVFYCKQLVDADKLNLGNGKKAVVIGSGAIGVEVAEALKRKGYDVSIIELLPWIMPTMFDEPAARLLENAMEKYGIQVFTDEKVLSIEGNENVTGVITDKRQISCDTVVMATGVILDKSLGESADLLIGRAIIVNNKMQTNVEDIFACGDCAETIDAFSIESCNYQLKHNAIDQAKIIAQNISGNEVSYIGAYSYARAHFFQTHASSFGKTMRMLNNTNNVELIEKEKNNDYLRVIIRSGKILGAQAIGKYADSMGLLMSATWQQNDINELKNNWQKVLQLDSPYPWTYRKLGHLLGFGY